MDGVTGVVQETQFCKWMLKVSTKGNVDIRVCDIPNKHFHSDWYSVSLVYPHGSATLEQFVHVRNIHDSGQVTTFGVNGPYNSI